MSEAIRVIKSEHAGIWRLLTTVDRLDRDLETPGSRPDAALFGNIFDYIEAYTDRMHHPKEDEYLFKTLRARNDESHAILDELQAEHRRGAQVMSELRTLLADSAAGDSQAVSRFREALASYVHHQREHIRKEETQVLPMARESLQAEDWRDIDRAFLDNQDPLFGQTVRAEFRDLYSRIVQFAPEPVGLGMEARPPPKPVVSRPVLRIAGLHSHYGRIQALDGIDLEIAEGELVALVGANGAGKTTLLRTISGLQPATAGRIEFFDDDITQVRAAARVGMGISQVPEGRQVFGPMSVEDNLRLGAFSRAKGSGAAGDLTRMFEMFPILEQKRRQAAGTLSGGQQQMLAIARALMARPRMLLLDEPSMGLAPLLVQEIFSAVSRLKEEGMTLFLVEQNAAAALSIADRGYVLETGRVVLTGPGSELLENEQVKAAYLGV